jgi:hypothetical protein
MKLWIAMIGAIATLTLIGAGAASATVSHTPGTDFGNYTWFVGRGDVIANFGKDALLPRLEASDTIVLTKTLACSYPDGTVRTVSGSMSGTFFGAVLARYAPGNSNVITGYWAPPLPFGDVVGEQLFDVGCPAPGSDNPYINDPSIPRTQIVTATVRFFMYGKLLFGPEVMYLP